MDLPWGDWATRVVLAFTVCCLWMLVLRRPWRNMLGMERAVLLWACIPLAIALALLPAPSTRHVITLSTGLRDLSADVLQVVAPVAPAIDAFWLVATIWLTGASVCATRLIAAQWRFERALAGATPLSCHDGVPVYLAAAPGIGPSQVGMFRRVIVLPADFRNRFTADEQTLVLAHEAIHARRFDGAWSALAHGVACAFWFHPLAWWALRAFRLDQELACDASVIRRYPSARRIYGVALLKNYPTAPLPAGCPWPSRHPLTERIAMLKSSPSKTRRVIAAALLPVALLTVAATAWSTTPSPTDGKPEYQVKADIEASGGDDAHVTLCTHENEPAYITTSPAGKGPWTITFKLARAPQPGMLDVTVQGDSDDGHHRVSSKQVLRGKPGEAMAIRYGNGTDSGLRKIFIVPSTGCEARRAKAS